MGNPIFRSINLSFSRVQPSDFPFGKTSIIYLRDWGSFFLKSFKGMGAFFSINGFAGRESDGELETACRITWSGSGEFRSATHRERTLKGSTKDDAPKDESGLGIRRE